MNTIDRVPTHHEGVARRFASLSLALAVLLAPAAEAHVIVRQTALTVQGVGVGPKLCVDCESPTPMSMTLCNSSTVTVTIGGASVGSFATGQSTSACVNVPSVAPDTCVWMEYHYSCTKSGFFGAWQCTPTGANVKVGDNPYC